MAIKDSKNYKGFDLPEGYFKAMYLAVNFGGPPATVNVEMFKDQASRESDPVGNKLDAFTVPNVTLNEEEMDLIRQAVYSALHRTEYFENGVKV